ncbi:MAG: GGDEF domain-containing protein [Verrucomicrobiales bacterium]|jgi:GGDEF domain-containing protein
MVTTLFDGSSLLLQDDLLHQPLEDTLFDIEPWHLPLDHLASSIRQVFAAYDNEGALLVVEIDEIHPLRAERQGSLLDHVAGIARSSIRRLDILEQVDARTIAIGLPGSGRIGMTRVADAIRQRVAASVVDIDTSMATTVTIGAVHTTESKLVDIDDLLLAARVNLDSARAAGGNRTNWSDWSSFH